MFKKKQKTNVIELLRDKEVVYRVTINPTFVQFESASKDWLLRYSVTTFEAGMVNYLISNDGLNELTELVRAQFMTRWMFRDAKVIKEFYREIERSTKRQSSVKQTQSDVEILAEQKAQQEQTAESIQELEKLKTRRDDSK